MSSYITNRLTKTIKIAIKIDQNKTDLKQSNIKHYYYYYKVQFSVAGQVPKQRATDRTDVQYWYFHSEFMGQPQAKKV